VGVNPKMVHNPLKQGKAREEPMSGAGGVLIRCPHLISTLPLNYSYCLPSSAHPHAPKMVICCFQRQTSLPTFFPSKLGNRYKESKNLKSGGFFDNK
jgi:hypothetical protein